jgi:hypothetical protein
MAFSPVRLRSCLLVTSILAALAGCEDGAEVTNPPPGVGGGGGMGGAGNAGGEGGTILSGPSSGPGGANMEGFEVDPDGPQTITVVAGSAMPTLTFHSTYNGNPISAGWGVDRGEMGTVDEGPANQTVFTPRGTVGGVAKVLAGLNDEIIEREVKIELTAEQNGPGASPAEQAQVAMNPGELTAGGGIGGVGGEGLGVAVIDAATLAALDAPGGDGSAENLHFLYPYDQTVWPRGLLAPLLQWDWSIGDADAIKIELETTSGSFRYKGTFGRPAVLSVTGDPMSRHPIPQDAWTMATNSAGGPTLDGSPDRLTMRLTVAKDGQAYGPITQTWTIAAGRLAGTIYYNSYGTQLAKNYTGAVGGDGTFGGAVLSIKVGDAAPQLAAGGNGNSSQCRVCHSVSADGSRLIAQHGDANAVSSGYAITPAGITEQALTTGAEFSAITPDGAYALNAAGQLLDLNNAGAVVPSSGLSSVTTDLGTPAFAPSGDRIVFNPMTGPGITNPTQKLVIMSFDPMTFTFSSPIELADSTGQPAETRPGWPAFFPDGSAIVFQQQTEAGVDPNTLGDLRTRKGAKAYLAWAAADGLTPAVALDQMNGVGLPSLPSPISMTCTGDLAQVGGLEADHADDANLNYEPTVNPVASGGYAWVVFTSRRMYGSVADIPPFCSDPRGVNLVDNITPKKLWVAAIDLGAAPGTDPSHPAFYLPAQEILAGNSRAFWVLDPCKMDGVGCDSGDQCCNGFCSSSGMGDDPLICAPSNPEGQCSMPQEHCDTAADCCDPGSLCINHFCAPATPD